MEADTRESGLMMYSRDKVKKLGLMEQSMWVIIRME
jgi:hypothetical protein